MKTFLRNIGWAAAAALVLPLAAQAQIEPVMAVELTEISVVGEFGSIIRVGVLAGGSGYSAVEPPLVTVSGGGGTGAELRATVSAGAVADVVIVNGGTGYTSFPTITIASPGVRATGTASVINGELTGIAIGNGGSGYTTPPAVTLSGGGGSGASATAVLTDGVVTAINVGSKGTGYSTTEPPTVTIAPPGTNATATVRGLGTLFAHPLQNESYGPVNATINLTAVARGTFPIGGFTYEFFANGISLGTSTNTQVAGSGPGRISWAPVQPGSYQITVRTTDGLGHTATSLAVRYFAFGTVIIGPVDNMLVPIGSSVVLQATAMASPSAPNAFAQRIDFYVDGVLVGTDSTYPYSYIYTPAATPSTHVIEARGYDNNGNQIFSDGSAQRRLKMVTPIGTPPQVRFVNPPGDASVAAGSPVNLIVDAVAPDGFIRNVDFFVNGVLLSASQTFPFTASWTPLVPGRYEFVAIARDDKSNHSSSMPITLTATGGFPATRITYPDRNGLTVVQGSILDVTVDATGPDGGIASLKSIEFLVDGVVNDMLPKIPPGGLSDVPPVLTEPFGFKWRASVVLGTHRLATRVTSLSNLTVTSTEVTVNVVANQAPTIALTSPTASSSVVMNTATTIVAVPADVDGTIDLVEFFVNETKVGSAAQSPFQVSWTPTVAGDFVITATATDDGGATATSAAVSVTVDPPASTGSTQPTISYSVYRGDYGSVSESGRFALAVSRNSRGTLVAYSTNPAGRSYIWTDIPMNSDGTFAVRDADNQVVLSGQTSGTGVSGIMNGRTFIGPITPATGAFTPLMVTGTLTGLPASRVVAIVGGDGSVIVHAASGNSREVGDAVLGGTGTFAVTAATGGRISGTVANAASIVSGTVSGGVTGNFLLRLQASRISNISARTLAGSGDRTLVAGFVVSGTGTKPLLIRAVGPTLANFGVSNPLADPDLSVLSRTSALIASNGDWGNSAALAALAAQVGAFPLTPGSRDAAAQVSVAPGSYTAVVGGGGTVLGSTLIEIYDVETTNSFTSRVTNISTRGQVVSGDALIAGFVVSGDVRKRVLIRAVGPTLSAFGMTGVLADPKIDVLSGTTVIASNNDWTERAVAAQVAATSPIVGAFPLAANSRDAALVLQLTPGSYTVQVSGVGTLSGTVLVEIYDADL